MAKKEIIDRELEKSISSLCRRRTNDQSSGQIFDDVSEKLRCAQKRAQRGRKLLAIYLKIINRKVESVLR